MTQDRPLIGIALMLGFCVMAPFGDALAKIIGQSASLAALLIVRFGVQVVALYPVAAAKGELRKRLAPRVLWLIALRTMMHIAGIAAMFAALRYLPLADAVAIVFVMPFFMLLLGKWLYDEEVGPARILASVAGFFGVLLVIKPSFAEVGLPALLPVLVAVLFSGFMLTTRRLSKDVEPLALQVVSGVMALPLMVPFIVAGQMIGLHDAQIYWPGAETAGLILAVGIMGTFAHLLMSWALKYAPGATLAPMQYLEIPFAVGIGFVLFGDLPDALALVGITITMAAGLFIIHREQTKEKARKAARPELGPMPTPAE